MLHDLIQIRGGTETVMMTDSLAKVNDRMKTLRASQRKGIKGQRVTYKVQPSEETDKYRKPPIKAFDPSGDVPYGPKKIRKK